LYKSCGSQSGLKGVEVAAEIAPLHVGEIIIHETGVMIEETVSGPIAVEAVLRHFHRCRYRSSPLWFFCWRELWSLGC
jgi:hypothetical protein